MDWREEERQQRARAAIESRLNAELDSARARHEDAKTRFDIENARARGIGLNHPDGAFALLEASRHYNLALHTYRMALGRFCDFILRGKLPGESGGEGGSQHPPGAERIA